MKLWTIQPIEWYEALLDMKIIYGDKKLIEEADFNLDAYHWMMQQMDKCIGVRPFPDCYPVWAWYQYNDAKRKKPDLRRCAHLQKGLKGVRIEIEKNDKNILLSDFDLWHFPLNQWNISDNEEEDNAFDKMLEEEEGENARFSHLPSTIKKQIVKTWDKIFDMDYSEEYATLPKECKSIQATFWTLSVDEIVKVEYFTAR